MKKKDNVFFFFFFFKIRLLYRLYYISTSVFSYYWKRITFVARNILRLIALYQL